MNLHRLGLGSLSLFSLVVRSGSISKGAELIALAKAQPGKISIASAGTGTLNHLSGEIIGKAAGIELLRVPYSAHRPR